MHIKLKGILDDTLRVLSVDFANLPKLLIFFR